MNIKQKHINSIIVEKLKNVVGKMHNQSKVKRIAKQIIAKENKLKRNIKKH